MCEEQTVSLVDVLEEDEELEEEASAVLAGSDSDHCSYPQVSVQIKRLEKHPHRPINLSPLRLGICKNFPADNLQSNR